MNIEKFRVRVVILMFAIALTIMVAQVQSQLLTGTPAESSSPVKHRPQKTTEATPRVETPPPNSASESPASASPAPRHIRRKTTAEVSPTPTPTPVASPTPHKFRIRFPRLFKPKSSPAVSPSA